MDREHVKGTAEIAVRRQARQGERFSPQRGR